MNDIQAIKREVRDAATKGNRRLPRKGTANRRIIVLKTEAGLQEYHVTKGWRRMA